MVSTCEDTAEYTWTLLSTEVYYGTWSRRHWVKQEWKWDLKCPGDCGEDPFPEFIVEYCTTEGARSGNVTREVMLKDIKNPNLTPEQVAILKECHRCSVPPCDGRQHFLDCVEKSRVVDDLTDLVDPAFMAGPPLAAECDSWVDGCECVVILKFLSWIANPFWGSMVKPLGKGRKYRDHSSEELRVKRVIARGGEENKLW
tara:strand:+ start:382 stop:981 length:600 start_codon:yes stop_codon:yes gene_type:complete